MINSNLNTLFTAVPENLASLDDIVALSLEHPKVIYFVRGTHNIVVNGLIYGNNEGLTYDASAIMDSSNVLTSGTIYDLLQDVDTVKTITEYPTSIDISVNDTHDEALSKLRKTIFENEYITAAALNQLNDEKLDAVQVQEKIDESLVSYVNNGTYDSSNKKIQFKHDASVLSEIDATDFIKDGMVSDVSVIGDDLVITFNTDAEKETIYIPITKIFDPSNYYTKAESEELFTNVQANWDTSDNTSDSYIVNKPTQITSEDISNGIDTTDKVVSAAVLKENFYTVDEIDDMLANKEDLWIMYDVLYDSENEEYVISDPDYSFMNLGHYNTRLVYATGGIGGTTYEFTYSRTDIKGTPMRPRVTQIYTAENYGEFHITENGITFIPYYTENIIDVTYNELVELRDNNQLIPGKFYKIIDYETTTSQEDTSVAGHLFSVVVQALTTNILSEDGKVVLLPDTYWDNCNGNAWEIKYCLDNDSSRFGWAVTDTQIITTPASIETSSDGIEYTRNDTIDTVIPSSQTPPRLVSYYGWSNNGSDIYTTKDVPSIGDTIYLYTSNDNMEVDPNNTVGTYTAPQETQGEPLGKGVIYYMKDEWGNECPYDFKNILFKRYAISDIYSRKLGETICSELIYDDDTMEQFMYSFKSSSYTMSAGLTEISVDSKQSNWYYTFSTIVYDEKSDTYDTINIEDQSIKGTNMYSDDPTFGCTHNSIKPYYDYIGSDHGRIDGAQYLNNIVFNGEYTSGLTEYWHFCNNNNIDINCYDMTFGPNCTNIHIGANSFNSLFGLGCTYINLGWESASNLITQCYSLTLDNYTFGNIISSCGQFYLDWQVSNNLLMNSYQVNIQASCDSCLMQWCQDITIGYRCSYINFHPYCKYINIYDNNSYITIDTTQTASWGNIIQNIIVTQCCNTASPGITITIDNLNANYQTYCGRNSQGTVVTWCPADHLLP